MAQPEVGPAVAWQAGGQWVGGAATPLRRAAINIAASAAVLTMIYSFGTAAASVGLFGNEQTVAPEEGTFRALAWQYQLTDVGWEVRYPSPLVLLSLLIPWILLGTILKRPNVVRKARGGAPVPRKLAMSHLEAELEASPWSALVTRSAQLHLVVAGVAAAGIALVGGLYQAGEGFTRGYPPTVVAAGGLITLAGVLLAMPWRRWPEAVVTADGTLVVDGVEPLARAGAPRWAGSLEAPPAFPVQAMPPPAAAPPAPPPPAAAPPWRATGPTATPTGHAAPRAAEAAPSAPAASGAPSPSPRPGAASEPTAGHAPAPGEVAPVPSTAPQEAPAAARPVAPAPRPVAPAPPPAGEVPPPGWFADPSGRHQHRYWDGHAWSDVVADEGITARDPVMSGAGPAR